MRPIRQLVGDRERVIQFAKYLAIGGGTYLLEVALYALFYYQVHLSAPLAKFPANALSAAINFTLNGKLAFRGVSNLPRAIVLYICLYLLNLVFQMAAISLLVDHWNVPALAANIVTQTCVVIWNFILYRQVIFR